MKFWNEEITKPVITINSDSFGLIIIKPTGVLYTNQVGGTACLHPVVEGVYVPFDNDMINLQEFDCFNGYGVLQEEQLNHIEKIITSNKQLSFLSVNRKLKSYEAWVNVIVKEPTWPRNMPELSILAGFGDCQGILTWPNSD